MSDKISDAVSWRIQGAVYGIGTFSTSVFYIGSVITPLYAMSMNPSPLLFGLVFSVANILPLLFSIHAGALMDRLGARRVLLVFTVVGSLLQRQGPCLGSPTCHVRGPACSSFVETACRDEPAGRAAGHCCRTAIADS